MATYVSLVNNAIDESGADLALYAEDGSDFTTNTEPMLNRFKTWVARAWKTVQQVAFDWEFLNNQGIVTLQPGLMFYTSVDIATAPTVATLDVYGTDGALLFNDVEVGSFVDLTYTQYSNTADSEFGYVDLDASASDPVGGYNFKAGGDYFYISDPYAITLGPQLPYYFDNNIVAGSVLSVSVVLDPLGTPSYYAYNNSATMVSFDPDVADLSKGSTSSVFSTKEPAIVNAINSGNCTISLYKNPIVDPTDPGASIFIASSESTTVSVETTDTKAYLHSWKSFSFSEETSSDDYVNELSEVDNNSFHIIDHEADSPSTTRPLTFVPWHIFSVQYDNLTTPPSTPIYITEDNTGRWRLYPHPDRPVTLKFSYSRTPQNLVEWDDEPKGLPADFTDLVMWLAVRMYGEFDEQPSVARRAERYYKDLLQRLQIKYRPKFHIKPKRLY